MIMWFRKTPSNVAPMPARALRDRSLRAVRLELDPFRAERLEGMGQLEQLGLAVRAGPLPRRRRPTSSRSRAGCAPARSSGSGCCRWPGRWPGRSSRTAVPMPASALARAVSTQRRRPAASCGPMIVHCQSGRSKATRDEVGQVVGAERLEADAVALEDDRFDPRLRCHRRMVAGRLLGCRGEPRPLRRAVGRAPRRASAGGHGHVPGRRHGPLVAPLVHLGGRRVHHRDGRRRRQAQAPPTRSAGDARGQRGRVPVPRVRDPRRSPAAGRPYGPIIRRIATRYVGSGGGRLLRRRARAARSLGSSPANGAAGISETT